MAHRQRLYISGEGFGSLKRIPAWRCEGCGFVVAWNNQVCIHCNAYEKGPSMVKWEPVKSAPGGSLLISRARRL